MHRLLSTKVTLHTATPPDADPEVLLKEAAEIVLTNPHEAGKKIKQAARTGYGPAFTALGRAHANGTFDISHDQGMALVCFEKAAEQDDPEGLSELATCYIKGLGVESNVYKSVPYLAQAAKLGQGNAQTMLGIFYYSGVAGERNLKMSGELFLDALKNENCTVKDEARSHLFTVTNHLLEGSDLCRKDTHTAFAFLRQFLPHAGEFTARVQYQLAMCLCTATGTEEDLDTGLAFLTESARAGMPLAIEKLAEVEEVADAKFEE